MFSIGSYSKMHEKGLERNEVLYSRMNNCYKNFPLYNFVSVTIKVSGVAPGTTEERIKAFFEEKGEDISVEILSSLEDDAVVVELIGVTETGK